MSQGNLRNKRIFLTHFVLILKSMVLIHKGVTAAHNLVKFSKFLQVTIYQPKHNKAIKKWISPRETWIKAFWSTVNQTHRKPSGRMLLALGSSLLLNRGWSWSGPGPPRTHLNWPNPTFFTGISVSSVTILYRRCDILQYYNADNYIFFI